MQPLSDTKITKIYEEEILPRIGARGKALTDPAFIVVNGQPGSGKSTRIRHIQFRLSDGGTQKIIPDDLLGYIPGNNEARLKGDFSVHRQNKRAVTKWYDDLTMRAIESKFNIVMESCHAPSAYDYYLQQAKSAGYKTELNIIATDNITSFTAIHDRFDRALKNGFLATTVLPDPNTHDRYYSLIPRAAYKAEEKQLFDRVAIFTREGEKIYENELIMGENGERKWRHGSNALEALMIARNRPLNESQRRWIEDAWKSVQESKSFASHPESSDIPVILHKDTVANLIRSKGGYDPFHPMDGDQRESCKLFRQYLARDANFIVHSRVNPPKFSDNFETRFFHKLQSVFHRLDRGFALEATTGAKFVIAGVSGSRGKVIEYVQPKANVLEKGGIGQAKFGDNGRPPEPKPTHAGTSQNVNRPKFLVEVRAGVFHAIEDYYKMFSNHEGYPTLNRNRGKLNALILRDDAKGYETPAVVKARSLVNGSERFATVMRQAKLPYKLARNGDAKLPAILVSLGTGRTFAAGERFPLVNGVRQIPNAISNNRILVRNGQNSYRELSELIANNTISSLGEVAKNQLGPERMAEITRSSPKLDRRSRDERTIATGLS